MFSLASNSKSFNNHAAQSQRYKRNPNLIYKELHRLIPHSQFRRRAYFDVAARLKRERHGLSLRYFAVFYAAIQAPTNDPLLSAKT